MPGATFDAVCFSQSKILGCLLTQFYLSDDLIPLPIIPSNDRSCTMLKKMR